MTRRSLIAGTTYWALIFALGFVLGTIRVLWLAPRLGETLAGFVELPFILGASWLVARWLVRRFAIRQTSEALATGGIAFALLMAAELVLATTLFEMSASEWLANITRPPGLYGLLGQIAFALMPWLAARGLRRTAT